MFKCLKKKIERIQFLIYSFAIFEWLEANDQQKTKKISFKFYFIFYLALSTHSLDLIEKEENYYKESKIIASKFSSIKYFFTFMCFFLENQLLSEINSLKNHKFFINLF